MRTAALGVVAWALAGCGLVSGLGEFGPGGERDSSTSPGAGGSMGQKPEASAASEDAEASDVLPSDGASGDSGGEGELDGGGMEDAFEDASEEGAPRPAGDASADAESDAAPGVEAGVPSEAGPIRDASGAPEAGGATPEAGGGASDAGSGTPDSGSTCSATNTVENCGACGAACNQTNARDAGCNGETCSYTCAPGFADCDTASPNLGGCATPTNTVSNCSGCDLACDTTTGTPSCNGTTCSYSCNSGLLDCNASTAPDLDGCESSVSSTSTCGGCLNACNTTTGTPSCNGTTCSYACNAGRVDCNTTAPNLNGCECAGTACCSGSCQSAHATGLSTGASATFFDCSSTVSTSTGTQAQEACEAYSGGSCSSSSTCCLGILVCLSTATAYCGTYNGASYCWVYGLVNPGTIQSGSSVSCSGNAGTW